MDTNVISLSAHRAIHRPLPRKGTKLIILAPKGDLTMALAPQGKIARAARSHSRPLQTTRG